MRAAHEAQAVREWRQGPGWHYCGVTMASPNNPAWRRLAPPRQLAAWGVAGLVLLAHVLLLGQVARAPGPGWRAQPPQLMHLRPITRLAPQAAAPTATAAAAPAPRHLARPSTPAGHPGADAAPAGTSAGTPAKPIDATTTGATPATAATVAALAQAVAEPQPDPGGQTVPVYATQRPPPLTLQFDLRRGLTSGQAELDWRPLGVHYQLSLRGQPLGAPLVGWASQGGFDDAGLAPLRYAESRRGREVRAAHFQRDSGRITFSGPAVEYPLVAGAQDRLSWMLQLAAVLAANPTLAEPEAQVSMWVVGTRGDAAVWTFTVQGRATLELPIGRVDDTVHLTRQAHRPYDTQVQVWLDPARHFVPVKVLLAVRASGEGTLLELRQVLAP